MGIERLLLIAAQGAALVASGFATTFLLADIYYHIRDRFRKR
jgi:hypothetical protein